MSVLLMMKLVFVLRKDLVCLCMASAGRFSALISSAEWSLSSGI